MSSAYDIDAINRMLGLDNDGDVTTAVLPNLDEHDATQQDTEPWLPDDLPVHVAPVQRITDRTPVTILPPSAPVKFTQVTQPGQKTNLMDAHRQWASRPADERFWNLDELIQRTGDCQRSSREIVVDPQELKVVSDGTDLQLMGGGLNGPARFTHWSFGQLSRLAGAPADYLRTLDGDLASECLNRGLQKRTESGKAGATRPSGAFAVPHPKRSSSVVPDMTLTCPPAAANDDTQSSVPSGRTLPAYSRPAKR